MPGILNALKLGVVSLRQGHLTGSVVDAKATSNLKGELGYRVSTGFGIFDVLGTYVRVVGELGLIYCRGTVSDEILLRKIGNPP